MAAISKTGYLLALTILILTYFGNAQSQELKCKEISNVGFEFSGNKWSPIKDYELIEFVVRDINVIVGDSFMYEIESTKGVLRDRLHCYRMSINNERQGPIMCDGFASQLFINLHTMKFQRLTGAGYIGPSTWRKSYPPLLSIGDCEPLP